MFPIRGASYRPFFLNSSTPEKRQLSVVMATQFTHEELLQYNGKGSSGKIYVALKGRVYDVTEKGKEFYGPGECG